MGFNFEFKKSNQNKFLIVTLCKNVEKHIVGCINSTKKQSYNRFLHVLIDDNSSDNTVKTIEENIKGDDRYILYKHNINFYTTSNHTLALMNFGNINDIVVHLDGDDEFYDEFVLEKLNRVYSDQNTWCTFGSYKRKQDGYCINRKEINLPDVFYDPKEMVKDLRWIFTHLRTFRKFLFYHLPFNYLIDSDYKFYRAAADVVLFLPIIQLAGKDRIKYIDDILLLYNYYEGNEHLHLKDEQDRAYMDAVFNKPKLNALTDEETKQYFKG